MFHSFPVQNYEIYAMQFFFTLYSFALSTVLRFPQFCTLHSFQIDLAHLWTDFQSCCHHFTLLEAALRESASLVTTTAILDLLEEE